MRKLLVLAGFIGIAATQTPASAANVNVDINLGAPPPPPVIVREVVTPPPPRPATRTVIIEEIPEFIYTPPLGIYVAVGSPYDLFYDDGYYYLYRDSRWYRGHDYNGPWKVIKRKHVPYGLRKHSFGTIRHHRDREYGVYQAERDHYRGKHFRPDKEWKERRRHEREEHRDHRRSERDEYRDHRKHEQQEYRDDRREHGERHGGRGRDH